MSIIEKRLDFILYKNNNIKINKNSIAYSKKNDRILFELDDDCFEFLLNDKKLEMKKENIDNIFKICNNEASLYLKKENLLLPVKVEDYNINYYEDEFIINYQLETDDEQTTIKIIL